MIPPVLKAAKPVGAATAHVKSSVGHNWLTNDLMVSIRNNLPVLPTPLKNIRSGARHICLLRALAGEGSMASLCQRHVSGQC